MNECVKNIMKIYIFILVILHILLGKFSFIHIYSVLLILNSTIGICGFLVNTSYSDLNKDNIYKHISLVFAFSGIINLVYAFSMLMYKHEYQHINTITHIGFLGIGVEILLTMYILNKHKNEINIKKIINTLIILTVLSLLVLCRTSVIPMVYSKSGITVYSFIVEIVYIIGAIYIIKNIKKLDNRISKRAMRDIQIYNVSRLVYLAFMLIYGVLSAYLKIYNTYIFLTLLLICLVNSICISKICYMDIIRRPNQLLYRNLLREKERLEEVNKGFKDYKNRYEEILMYLPDGVIVCEDGVIVFANEKINEYFNLYSSDYILGRTLFDIVDESERESIKKIDDIKKPVKYLNLKYSFRGTEFYGEQTNIIKRRKNKTLSIFIIKNMEDRIKLAKIKEELEYNKTLDEIKNQVLANISHDFKTPVNVIYSTVQMQDLNIKKKKYDNLIEFNQIIRQNCNRLIKQINNFIDSIKLESDKLHVDLKYVNIVSLVEDITDSVLTYATERNINLIFDTEHEEVYTSVDTQFIEKIILNLLSNAIKYNKENGSVDVKVEDTDQLIIISVKDTGVGIPKRKLKNIFNRYERAERDSIETKEGSGIGLNIVKQMIEALNGAIDISSVEGKGTVVKVILQKNDDAKLEEDEAIKA
ncbi:sensor histidine kinase [Romboutsia sp. 1001713B170207_170306_H8]|uniref:sensor histidine kinase n=2 Tax=unclassified Romboutsia TaxID=2626894 RepID=UPI0018988F19|nr:PAS domain-containing sensor histidine kinase [Romboutsia sp. 1001713B170207_170306_H8]